MIRSVLSPSACGALLLSLGARATVDPAPDYGRVADLVETATGRADLYRPGDDATTRARVAELLADGLTADEAVQLCLLNNLRLQAALYSVGIARAEFVQSSLFTNPTLALSLRFPDGGGLADFEADVAQGIADLWQIPRRKKAAAKELDRAILDAARLANVTALEAKAAFVKAVQADRHRAIAIENVTVAQQLLDLAIARREAGSGNEIDINLARTQRLETDTRTRRVSLAAVEARADLAKLLGLTTSPHELVLSGDLSDSPPLTATVEQVIEVARANRLDLQAARASAQAAQERIALEKTRFLRSLELGISAEREARRSPGDRNWLADTAWSSAEAGQLSAPSFRPREDEPTDWVVGPTLGLELPIFDQNQAQIAKAEYEYEQLSRVVESLERELVQDTYTGFERAHSANTNARFYREEFLPLQARSLELAHSAYRSGQATMLTVLETQRALLSGRSDYADILADAAIALIKLEGIAGRPAAHWSGAKNQNPAASGAGSAPPAFSEEGS